MSLEKMKKNLKNMSIKGKVFLYLIGFCSILLILLWCFQIIFLDKFYKNIKIREVKNSAIEIAKHINKDDLEEVVEDLASHNDLCIEIISANGTRIKSAEGANQCIIHRMPQFEKVKFFVEAEEKGGEMLEHYDANKPKDNVYEKDKVMIKEKDKDKEAPKTIIYSKIVKDKEGQQYAILVNSMISPVDATVQTLRVQLYYITVAMILFSILLALAIAKRVSKPIENINKSAKTLATGDYEVKFYGSGYKEINELSDTLNYAAVELAKVDGLRKELIANVSHDLRTPLTLIGGYAEVMRDIPNENNSENAQIIIDESKRLTTLVNDMLDISKIQAGVQKVDMKEFNLTEALNEVINRMSELVKKDGYNIKFSYDKEVRVKADGPKICQAFYNLVINAINYTGNDKSVEIIQVLKNNMVEIQVKDRGIGISEESLPYIWERYYKVDKTHKRPITGTGLGLSIVKSIIELHGGQYGVNSKINEGSTFWFRLKL